MKRRRTGHQPTSSESASEAESDNSCQPARQTRAGARHALAAPLHTHSMPLFLLQPAATELGELQLQVLRSGGHDHRAKRGLSARDQKRPTIRSCLFNT